MIISESLLSWTSFLEAVSKIGLSLKQNHYKQVQILDTHSVAWFICCLCMVITNDSELSEWKFLLLGWFNCQQNWRAFQRSRRRSIGKDSPANCRPRRHPGKLIYLIFKELIDSLFKVHCLNRFIRILIALIFLNSLI